MEEQDANVSVDSSPIENKDVTPESSQATLAETPAQQVEQEKPVPFHEHPRWKEKMQELEYYKQLALKAVERPVQAPQPAVVDDPYAGMDEQTKAFWRQVDDRAEKIATRRVAEKEDVIKRELAQTREITANVLYKNFLKENPDVVPGSQEENEIAQYVSRGYPLEHAKKVVMYDRIVQTKAQAVKQTQVNRIEQKQKANLETATIPPVNGIPQKVKLSFREIMDQKMKEAGY
jgi:hypothetical protein